MEPSYRRLRRVVSETPWAILPSKLAAILELVQLRVEGYRLSDEEVQARIGAARPKPAQNRVGTVAVIPLYGVVAPKANLMSDISGGTSLEQFSSTFQEALASDQVGSILIDVNSPGGAVDLVPETAAMLRSARGTKPIVAIANTDAASAAYWLAAQADELVVTPSGSVGSIGVFAAHDDISAAMEMAGVKTTLISAGEHKTDGNPFEPLSEEARAAIQKDVNAYYSMFVGDVAKGRGVETQAVLDGFGQGRMVMARDAVRAGMADRVSTFEETLARMAGGPVSRRARRAEAEITGAARLAAASVTQTTAIGDVFAGSAAGGSTANGSSASYTIKPVLRAGPIEPHSTAVVDEPWDAGPVEKNLPGGEQKTWTSVFAWFDDTADDPDGDGYPDAKAAWKFPHHTKVDGPANINGVNNAMARVENSNIPETDKQGVRAHLQRHQDDFKKKQASVVKPAEPAPSGPPSRATAHSKPARKESTTMYVSIEELVARQDEIKARQEEIDTEYAGQEMSPDSKAEFKALDEEWDNLQDAVTDIQNRKASLERKVGQEDKVDKPRGGPNTNVGRKVPENIYDMAGYRTRASSLDDLAAMHTDGAKRALELASFPHPQANREDAQADIDRLLAQDSHKGDIARRLLITGSKEYARAFAKAISGGHLTGGESQALAMQAQLNIGTGGDGGFAVPFTLDPTLVRTSNGAVNPWRQLAALKTTTGNTWKGVTSDGVTAKYDAEQAVVDDGTPALLQPEIIVEKAHAFVPFTIEIGEDWAAIQSDLAMVIQDAKDQKEAQKFALGAGHGSKEPEGVVSGLGGGSAVDTATADTFVLADIDALDNALPPRFEPNGQIVANKAFYNAIRALAGEKFDIWMPLAQGILKGPNGQTGRTLAGYPAWRCSEISSLLTTGSELVALLGDFRYFAIVDRVGLNLELIQHIMDPSTGFPMGMRGLYAYWRNSSGILSDNAFRVLRIKHS